MPARLRRVGLPYLLLLPGLGWLLAFFLIPMVIMAIESLKTGAIETGFTFTWEFANYTDALSNYGEQFLRSFEYAGLATFFALLIGYPLAYVNYVCPVEGVQEILEKRDPELAKSQFIFPDEQTLQGAFVFRGLKPEEARELDDAFQQVIGA